MTSPHNADDAFSRNLRELMRYFSLSNAQLAKALGVDNSLVSRWLSGQRTIRKCPAYAERIAAYIVPHISSGKDVHWLKNRISLVYRDAAISSAAELQHWTARWLYPASSVPARDDSAFSSMLLVDSFSSALTDDAPRAVPIVASDSGFSVRTGTQQIAELLAGQLSVLEQGGQVLLFLSSESVVSAVDRGVVSVIREQAARRELKVSMLIQSSNNSAAMSALLSAYMPLLVGPQLELQVIQGTPQTFGMFMSVLIPGHCAVQINETALGVTPPVATVSSDPMYLKDLIDSFYRSRRYARPMMTVFNDSFARNIIEVFFEEYGMPGALDVIKDGLNPMYMPLDAYHDALGELGYDAQGFAWRFAEFTRFQGAMDEVLKSSSFREVLSLTRLREIAKTGRCRMPGMYFMSPGIHEIGPATCVATLEGYIRYLKSSANLSVVILEDEELFRPNSCWHIKANKHIMIHSWNQAEPTMIYSDQLMLIDEFHRHFEGLWSRENRIGVSDRFAIETIQSVIDRVRTVFLS